jgi:hypothetical protein
MIVAELTAAQIQEIAQLSEVQSVHEDAIFTTMDGVFRTDELAGEAAPALANDSDTGNTNSPSPYLLLLIPFALLAAFLARKRLINPNPRT